MEECASDGCSGAFYIKASEKVEVILMEKAKIKTLNDLNRLKIGETYEVDEWRLEPEIIEERKKSCL